MYSKGQEIEYANGLEARVEAAFTDGRFVIYDYQEKKYAACQYDIDNTEEDVWSFIYEANPFVDLLATALLQAAEFETKTEEQVSLEMFISESTGLDSRGSFFTGVVAGLGIIGLAALDETHKVCVVFESPPELEKSHRIDLIGIFRYGDGQLRVQLHEPDSDEASVIAVRLDRPRDAADEAWIVLREK